MTHTGSDPLAWPDTDRVIRIVIEPAGAPSPTRPRAAPREPAPPSMSTAVQTICKGCGGAIVPPGPIVTMIGHDGRYHVACSTAAVANVAVEAERNACAEKARELAAHYPAGPDGRNTFIILAEWIENRATTQSA